MSIGKKILTLRKRLGLSQEQMANDLHVSRQTISKWESDLSLPDMNTVLLMSELYKINVTELLGIDESKDDSITQLYEQMNFVSQNIDKGNKRRMIFDMVLICVCVLSLCFNALSIVVLLRRPAVVNNNYPSHVVQEDDTIFTDRNIEVLKYHFDDMTMDVNIHCSVGTKYLGSQVSCYMQDQNGKEYTYPMKNTKNYEYEFNGKIPLQNYSKALVEMKKDEQVLTKEVLSDTNYLHKVLCDYIELVIPYEVDKKGNHIMLWDKIDYKILYSHVEGNGAYGYSNAKIDQNDLGIGPIRCDGTIKGTLKIKIINSKTNNVHFDKTIDLEKEGRYDTRIPFENLEDVYLEGVIDINGQKEEIYDGIKLVSNFNTWQVIKLYSRN